MSDLDLLRRLKNAEDAIGRLKVRENGAIYLSFAQRVLNPFPLASSGGAFGDIAQPWNVTLLALYVTVNVGSPNDGSNYWTVVLVDDAGSTLASVTTAAVTAGVYTRLSTTLMTQPGSSNARMGLRATATGNPGAVFLMPLLGLARTG